VIVLLNRIPAPDGGAGGSLGGRIVAGISSDGLYKAIVGFESKYFPGQRKGFVDPGGPMLKRLEDLAASKAATPPKEADKEMPLDVLRRNLADYSKKLGWHPDQVGYYWPPIIDTAVNFVDMWKKAGLIDVLVPAVLFGRAHLTKDVAFYSDNGGWVQRQQLNFVPRNGPDSAWKEAPPLPEMRYGQPVDLSMSVVTEKHDAVLLFQGGVFLRLMPYRQTVDTMSATWRRLKTDVKTPYDRELDNHP
jgi:hypothetical protein